MKLAPFMILGAVLGLALAGCDTRPIAEVASSTGAGAASGAAVGGPWGALIGAGLGLVAGLGRAMQVGRQKNTIVADVTRGVGDYLENALNPAEFDNLTGEQAVNLAKQRLRESLASHYTDFTRAVVRTAKESAA